METYTIATRAKNETFKCAYLVASSPLDKHVAELVNTVINDIAEVVTVYVIKGSWLPGSVDFVMSTLPDSVVIEWSKKNDRIFYNL